VKTKRTLRSERGESLLEFALLLPFLLLMLLGVIEVGRYAYIDILVGNAARAGAAYGTQTSITAADTAGIQTAAQNDFRNNGQSASALSVSSASGCACDNSGHISAIDCASTALPICPVGQREVTSLQVTATATFSPLFHGSFGVPQMTMLSKTATMRVGECPTCAQ